MRETNPADLAVNGGRPVRTTPMPPRRIFGPEERDAALRVFDRSLTSGEAFGYNGEEERAFEREFAAALGGGFADGVNSGTSAVFVALGALQLPPGSEVVVPPITDPGGVMPVAMLNCIPVVADSAPGSYNMGPAELERVISPATRAVVVAHIGGLPAEMPGIMKTARKHGLYVIEDCAQAHGTRLGGKPVGTFGHIAAFSTMSGKHMATAAQGGVVFTRDEDLYWRAKRFADRGKPFNLEDETGNVLPGLNLNLNDLAAAVGRVQLHKLPGVVARRREIAAAVHAGIADIPCLRPANVIAGAEASYWFLPIQVHPGRLTVSKDEFAAAVAAEGIPVTASYRHLPAEGKWFRERADCPTPYLYRERPFTPPRLENTLHAVETHFNLQIHEGFDKTALEDTIKALRKVAQAYDKERLHHDA